MGLLNLRSLTAAALALLMIATLGCYSRDTPDLGRVSGTVTLDGQPLPDASVRFVPIGEGSPSAAKTDAEGKYTLQYSVGIEGAMVGEHKVFVTTYRQQHNPDGDPIEVPEKVPPQYNSETILTKEVTGGKQTIDLPLTGALPVE